jgi:hypothetical protein
MDRDQLKPLLSRILGIEIEDVAVGSIEDVVGHDETTPDADCGVKESLRERITFLSTMPHGSSKDEDILKFTLRKLEEAHRALAKEARQMELEEEMVMLQKPDDVDLIAPEHEHLRLHIEHRSVSIEIRKREAIAYRRFCEIVRRELLD